MAVIHNMLGNNIAVGTFFVSVNRVLNENGLRIIINLQPYNLSKKIMI